MQVILGSHSPRRREILSYFSLPFTQVVSDYDEEQEPFLNNPEEYACRVAQGKARSLAQRFPEAAIITADTIVYRAGKIYGKPRTLEEAFQSLSELVGQWHTVYTAVVVRRGEEEFSQVEATRVLFNALTPEQIHHYLSRQEWADKAGAYAIQMNGGLIVRRIEGCYYNVMGLPINTLEALLKKVGIELWDYL